MSNTSKWVLRIVLGVATIGCDLFLSDDWVVTGPQLVKPAQAYIGNPLTPMSYAGVARRTARRTARRNYYYGGGYPYGGVPYGGAPYGGVPYGGAPYGGVPYGY
jgi:hypothetical protein